MKYDYKDSERFFGALYAGVYGYYEVRSLPSGKQSFHKDMSGLVNSPLHHDGDIYFGVGIRKEAKGGNDGISAIPAIWAEFDFKDYGGSKRATEWTIKQVKHKPSLINFSGNGYHCYWRIGNGGIPITTDTTRLRVEGILKGFARAVGADVKATNLERILRVPGTWNLKDKHRPKKVENIYCGSSTYDISQFDEFWVEPQQKVKVAVHNHVSDYNTGISGDIERLIKNSPSVGDLWAGRKSSGDTSRSGMDFSLAMTLANLEVQPHDIATALMNFEYGKARIEGDRYIQHTVDRAVTFCMDRR